MNLIKMTILKMMIYLCDMALKNQDGADDQNDVNDMVRTRNRCMVALQQIQLKQIERAE